MRAAVEAADKATFAIVPKPNPDDARSLGLAAAVQALHARREQSRTANTPWPTIEEECRIVLTAGVASQTHEIAKAIGNID